VSVRTLHEAVHKCGVREMQVSGNVGLAVTRYDLD